VAIKLSNREKYAVYAATGALSVFALLQFVLFPALDNRTQLKRHLQVKRSALVEMRKLQADYHAIQQQSEQLKRRYTSRTKGFTLFSFLDRLASDTGIKDHIAYMKPSSTVQRNQSYKVLTVEMKLQGVGLDVLTKYLYGIETSQNIVVIKRASFVKKGKDKGALDVVLQVETIET
jgi:general secretion pathway protein M